MLVVLGTARLVRLVMVRAVRLVGLVLALLMFSARTRLSVAFVVGRGM